MEFGEELLRVLKECKDGKLSSLSYSEKCGIDHQKIVGGIKSLECLDGLIETQILSAKRWELTKEGEKVKKEGSHEGCVFNAIPSEGGIPQPQLMSKLPKDIAKVGFSKAMSAGWIHIDKSDGKTSLVKRQVSEILDQVQIDLKNIEEIQDKENVLKEYKKRKLVQEITTKYYVISKGPKFTTTIKKPETEITSDMLAKGTWKDADFKPYNFDALGTIPSAGHLHPLLKVRAEYRQIFLEMGFTEMPTNNFVESSFWNFDALFQPQQHPARDAHDTFFISDPASCTTFPEEYLERVKRVHSSGGFGSTGYGYDWKIEEAQKNLLRTHTTAVSARMLYRLMNEEDGKTKKQFKPQKYFSIDRVFRNETLDATHLAEFHQIEGVMADRGLTLGDLIGVLYEFFKKLGIEKLRFKPAYNPYTEPSMEIFSYHEGLKKWVEIGNSGIFRPEMLLPMGLPDDVNVIAWGLSLERPTMIKYKIDNIRDLCGHKINLKMVERNPICRLDKSTGDPLKTLIEITEKRWDKITSKLEFLESISNSYPNIKSIKNISLNKKLNLVIKADPQFLPFCIPILLANTNRLKSKIRAQTHIHSNVYTLPNESIKDFLSINENQSRTWADININFIWRQSTSKDPSLVVGGSSIIIEGEVNIVRFLLRNLSLDQGYSNCDSFEYLLDSIHQNLAHGSSAVASKYIKSFKVNTNSLIGLLIWSLGNQRGFVLEPIRSWLIPLLQDSEQSYKLVKKFNNPKVIKL